jgi:hypothetical protein
MDSNELGQGRVEVDGLASWPDAVNFAETMVDEAFCADGTLETAWLNATFRCHSGGILQQDYPSEE